MMKQMRIQRLPQRIQRSRQKGWKSPPNTIHATRPNRYGNRWLTAQEYEDMGIPALTEEDLETLLAADFISCWCAYTDDCHVSRIIHRLGRYLERKQRENSGESYLDKKMLMDAINTFAVQGERIRDRWLSYITFQKWSNSAEVSWDWLLETVSLLTPAVKAIIEVRALADQQEVYFDSSEQESLTETQLDHCVEKLLDADYESPEDWPDVLEVIRYRRMTAGSDSMNILEDTLEKLDVNFQSLDGYVQTEQTVSLKAAEARFIDSILLEYTTVWCEQDKIIKVPVRDWLMRHGITPPPVSFRKQVCPHCWEVKGSGGFGTCANCGRRACYACRYNENHPWYTVPRTTTYPPYASLCNFQRLEGSQKLDLIGLH